MNQEITENSNPDREAFTHCNLYDSDEDVEIQCKICDLSFQTKTCLLNHMRVHQRIKGFTCAMCFEEFDSNQALMDHKKRPDHEDQMSLCKQCQLAFSDHLDYLQHMVTHTKGPPYLCKECPKTLNSKATIRIHIRTHFDRLIECEICGKYFKGEDRFSLHLKNHSKDFDCGECGKVCKSAEMLRYHMVSHTGVKKFQCIYCGKGYANKTSRKVHTRIHTGERPCTCKVCGVGFGQKADLQKHVICKHSRKVYKCEICDKKYKQKSSLKVHLKTHTRKNLFPCPDCGKEFTTFSSLKIHTIYTHATDRLHRCDVCKLSFKLFCALLRHNRSILHKKNAHNAMSKK